MLLRLVLLFSGYGDPFGVAFFIGIKKKPDINAGPLVLWVAEI